MSEPLLDRAVAAVHPCVQIAVLLLRDSPRRAEHALLERADALDGLD